MGYRKVTYAEQCFYIIKWWAKEKFISLFKKSLQGGKPPLINGGKSHEQ